MRYQPLKNLLTVQKGKKPVRVVTEQRDGYDPYIDIRAFERHVAERFTDGEHAVACDDGDLLLVWDGSRTGLAGRAQKGYVGSTLARVSARGVSNDFLYYFLMGNFKRLNVSAKGTGIPHMNPQVLGNLMLPVLTEEEQEKTVARVRALLQETDDGVRQLNRVRQQLDIYRRAVLTEAFKDCLEKQPIGGLSSLVTSGSRGWAKYYDFNGVPFIRIGDLTRTGISIDLERAKRVLPPKKIEGKRSLLEAGDVLISITADIGCVGLVPEGVGDAYINQHIAMVRFYSKQQAQFFAWYLRSPYGQEDLRRNVRGGSKPGLGLDDIRNCPVPIVTEETAKKICGALTIRLAACERAEAAVELALLQAGELRQGILENAFTGDEKENEYA